MNNKRIDDRKFLAWLTFALILASLWVFYRAVPSVLALTFAAANLYSSGIKKTETPKE